MNNAFSEQMTFKLKFPFQSITNILLSKNKLGLLIFKCLNILNEVEETDSFSFDYLTKKVLVGKLALLIKFKRADSNFTSVINLTEENSIRSTLKLSLNESVKFSVPDFGKCFSAELKELIIQQSHVVKATSLFACSMKKMLKFFVNPSKTDYNELFNASIEGDLLEKGNVLQMKLPGQIVVATLLKAILVEEDSIMWEISCVITTDKEKFEYEVRNKLTPLSNECCMYEAETKCDGRMTIDEVNQYKTNNVNYLAVIKRFSEK